MNGYITTFGVNALGETISIQRGTANDTRTITYYPDGQPQQITDALGDTTSFTYDHGLLSSVTDALGRTTSYYHDAVGRLAQVTDPLGNVTQTQYDPIWGVTRVTDPLGNNVSRTYTKNGELKSVTDQNTNVTRYVYDANDRLYTRTDALGVAATYSSYDGLGDLLAMTDRNGQVSSYTWDDFGDLLTGSFADGTSTSYTYNGWGRLTSASDSATGTLTRTWDNIRTYYDSYSAGSAPQGKVQYWWNLNGLPWQMSVLGPDNATLKYVYGYDSAQRFNSATATNQSAVSITYDAADRKYQETLPDGIVATYAYDNANELTSITYMNGTTNVGTLTYSYDADGRVSARGGTLFQAILPSGTALPTSASYNVDNRLTAWTIASGGTKPTYDPNGNEICDNYSTSMSSCTGRTLSWDARNRLTQVSSGGSTLASFAYDALNRRVSVTSGGTTTGTLYNGRFDPVQDQVGTTVTANVWTGLGMDERFARTTSGGTVTYLTDALGSSVALANASGVVQTSYGYDATGNTTTSGTVNTNSFEYTGRQADATGYYYYRARYYNPQIGRFLAEDPLGFDGGDANIYLYAGGDPADYTDPLGLGQTKGERGQTGGSSGLATPNPYKHCKLDPSDPNYIVCKDPHTGKKVRKRKPADFPCPPAQSSATAPSPAPTPDPAPTQPVAPLPAPSPAPGVAPEPMGPMEMPELFPELPEMSRSNCHYNLYKSLI